MQETNIREVDISLDSEIMGQVYFKGIQRFTFEQIRAYIKEKKEIGKGSWGVVYEGTITGEDKDKDKDKDEDEKVIMKVAVKVGVHSCYKSGKLDDNFIQWKAEIEYIPTIKHAGVIKLVGVCCTNLRLYLVYPLYVKGDLQKNIPELNWEKGLNVILKVGEALEELHNKENQFICRGLKATDILLDDKWNPIWTDFGRMRAFGEPLTGSHVYEGEDKIFTGHLDQVRDYDIYSMGVLMLQILMKEKECDFKVKVEEKEPIDPDIATHTCVYSSEIKERAMELKEKYTHAVHPDYINTGCKELIATEITKVALLCLHNSGVMRPMARELVTRLKKISNISMSARRFE